MKSGKIAEDIRMKAAATAAPAKATAGRRGQKTRESAQRKIERAERHKAAKASATKMH